MINKQFYSFFSRRIGVNEAVRHISNINRILDGCGYKRNLVDIISNIMQDEALDEMQLKSMIHTILCDKWNYLSYPINLATRPKNADLIVDTMSTWTGVDIVLTYETDETGFIVINPKNPEFRDVFSLLRPKELLTIYAGYQGRGKLSYDIFLTMIDAINKMLLGEEGVVSKAVLEGKYAYKELPASLTPFKKKKISNDTVSFATSPYQMTKFFPIKIETSGFGDKNINAVKRIIKDYIDHYKDANVYIFYKGELVLNLEKLMKDGILKKGSVLEVSVKDFAIQEATRLFKYLQEALTENCEIFTSDSPDIRGNLF